MKRERNVRRTGLIALSLVAVPVLLLVIVQLMPSADSGTYPNGLPASIVPLSADGSAGAYQTESLTEYGTESEEGSILARVRDGRVDLQLELRRLRAACPDPANQVSCDEHVVRTLAKIPEPDGSRLLGLFRTFQEYERVLAGHSPRPGLSPEQRYALLRELRVRLFGPEDARLVFGVEEANYAYQNLLRRALAGEFRGAHSARVEAFESERQKLFGEFYGTLLRKEGPNRRYAMELVLMENDLSGLSEAARNAALRDLRVRHFGAVAADRMEAQAAAKAESVRRSEQRLDEFLAAEQKLLRENPGLSGSEKRARIEALRKEHLGDRSDI